MSATGILPAARKMARAFSPQGISTNPSAMRSRSSATFSRSRAASPPLSATSTLNPCASSACSTPSITRMLNMLESAGTITPTSMLRPVFMERASALRR